MCSRIIKSYQTLVLSGGGFNGFTYLGCIQYMKEHKILSKFKNIIGSSIGAVFALAICLDINIETLKQYIIEMVGYMKDDNKVDIKTLINIWYKLGAFDNSHLCKIICKMLTDNGMTEDSTFTDIAKKTGVNLVISASNLTKYRIEYFCMENNNNVNVVTAIQASCCVPLIYKPLVIDDQLYVDAGLLCNTPSQYWLEKKCIDKDILIIKFKENKSELHNQSKIPTSLLEYMSLIINNLFFEINEKRLVGSSVIEIPVTSHVAKQLINNEICIKELDEYTKKGYQCIDTFFTSVYSSVPLR